MLGGFMPTSVGWENDEKTIIRQQLIGDWTFEEYTASARETQMLTASVPHTVHVIIDFTESISYPTKLLSVGSSLDRNMPANQGLLVVIQVPAYIRALFEVMSKLYPKIGQDSFEVNTLDEAHAVIRERVAEAQSRDAES
jgi:hypothetical protein